MSTFPYGGTSNYEVGDLKITSPTPAIFFDNYAAVPGVSTDDNFPLQKRQVVNHHFTGVDVPLLYPEELRARLGPDYPDPYQPGVDEYGIPNSLSERREDLLDAAARVNLDKSDKVAKPGQTFTVRAECVALTGHRFPAGFSQERTTYLQLSVTDDNGLLLYQSGYVVDKPHPETGEMQPDGNLDDEDIEHVHATVDPGNHNRDPKQPYPNGQTTNAGHTNQVFEAGPDDGPDSRLYFGFNEGLVLFRNELDEDLVARPKFGQNRCRRQSDCHHQAALRGDVQRRSRQHSGQFPCAPAFGSANLQLRHHAADRRGVGRVGMDSIKAPLHVHAQINYEHFPPLFLRFLTRTTGPNGPTGTRSAPDHREADRRSTEESEEYRVRGHYRKRQE